MKIAAGILIMARNSGRVFLLKRNRFGKYPGYWSLLSGEVEDNESIKDGLKREINEETGLNPNKVNIHYVYNETNKYLKFYYFIGFVDNEFIPDISFGENGPENIDYGWFQVGELPTPIFPGLYDKIIDLWKAKMTSSKKSNTTITRKNV